jgi:hypothetical protein
MKKDTKARGTGRPPASKRPRRARGVALAASAVVGASLATASTAAAAGDPSSAPPENFGTCTAVFDHGAPSPPLPVPQVRPKRGCFPLRP